MYLEWLCNYTNYGNPVLHKTSHHLSNFSLDVRMVHLCFLYAEILTLLGPMIEQCWSITFIAVLYSIDSLVQSSRYGMFSLHTQALDILHPSTCLKWEEMPSLPEEMIRACSVYLNGTLYVGGGTLPDMRDDDAALYSFKPGVDSTWTVTDTPTCRYNLVVHDSELLLVGGYIFSTKEVTNKVFTMRGGQFVEALPPMKERRESLSAVSSGSALVVAGGWNTSGGLSSVEVFKDGQWTTAPSLPSIGCSMKSALHGDEWYLITPLRKVFHTLLKSLISGANQSPWEMLPDAPNRSSAAALFGGNLLSIGGGDYHNSTTNIYAFFSRTQSWEHVADLPMPLSWPTVVLSSEQLFVSSRARVFRGTLTGESM